MVLVVVLSQAEAAGRDGPHRGLRVHYNNKKRFNMQVLSTGALAISELGVTQVQQAVQLSFGDVAKLCTTLSFR